MLHRGRFHATAASRNDWEDTQVPATLGGAPEDAGLLRRYLPPEDRRVLLFVLGAKVLIFLFGVVAIHVDGNRPLMITETVLEVWNRWDAPHYVSLARDGYVTA